MKQTHSPSLSDEIVHIQSYTELINSERETLWARHNALLVANSLIIGALAISPSSLWEREWAALAMLSAGLVISGVWIGIASLGWSALKRHAEIAAAFASTRCSHLPNPFTEAFCNRAQARIHYLMLLVIWVFMLMYVGLGLVRLS